MSTLEELHNLMVEQITRRGFYPHDEKSVLLHIVEEVGELSQTLRQGGSEETIAFEVADVFWHLLRFCELKNIDLEDAFMAKYKYNESRPLPSKDDDWHGE